MGEWTGKSLEQATKDRFLELWNARELTVAEIATEMGFSLRHAYRVRDLLGITQPRTLAARKTTPGRILKAQALFDQGLSINQVHQRTRMSRNTIRKYFPAGTRWDLNEDTGLPVRRNI